MTGSEPVTILTARFTEALVYATALHATQRRKGSSEPDVMQILSVAVERPASRARSHTLACFPLPVHGNATHRATSMRPYQPCIRRPTCSYTSLSSRAGLNSTYVIPSSLRAVCPGGR
jgi:hypothetical protein